MVPEAADPVSTSALGGALRTHALTLVGLLELLGEPAAVGPSDGAPETCRERDLIRAVADELDRIGAVLQRLATGDVERSVRRRNLRREAARHELDIEGTRVCPRPGPSRVAPDTRAQVRERLQELLNRVAAAQGRDLASFSRDLDVSLVVLRGISERARSVQTVQ
ncbi:hypothetical protein [Intrasporangium sp.]|uniref:hypothetical protein n=1 Tax=Intrasporangium sp. TaxID=1925024 RepID=UPI003221E229